MRRVLMMILLGLGPASYADIVHHVVYGPSASSNAGRAVCGMGDVDLDGFDDFAVGMPGDSLGRLTGGTVRVYSGATGSQLAAVGGTVSSRLGFALTGPGDLNGDGYPDLLAGAPHHDQSRGMVRAYSGKWIALGVGSAELFTVIGTPGSLFGWSLASGPVNTDGVNDFAVGAPIEMATYIYDGATHQLIFARDNNSISFGLSVCLPGDLDQDGRGEFIVGASSDSEGGLDRGAIFVYSGLTGSLLIKVNGLADEAFFGQSVASIDDIDGDQVRDVLVGANGEPGGYARIYSGRRLTQGIETVLFHDQGEGNFDGVGFSGADAGDFNGDGHGDFAIGDYPLSRVRVFSGSTLQVLETYDFNLSSLGHSIGSAGDVDADGFDDLIAGAPWDDPVFVNSGEALVFGGTPCPAEASVYGAGWPGTNGIPTCAANGEPEMGKVLSITIGNSRGGVTIPGVLFLGITQATLPTAWDGELLLLPTLALSLAIPGAGLILPLSVPSYGPLCGANVYLQVLMADSGASKGVAFTPGLELTLGE